MADKYEALQSWGFALVLFAAVGYYYASTGKKARSKQPPKSTPARETRPEVKKAAKKVPSHAEKAAAAPRDVSSGSEQQPQVSQSGLKKRKANTQAPIPTSSDATAGQMDDDEIDMSTRHFAESLRRAQEGTDLKKTNKTEARVKTVKAKNSQAIDAPTPVFEPSSQPEDDSRASAASTALQTSGVADMIEPAASGPNSLRITAPTKPVKEKTNKPKKEAQEETKKARQNRQRKEAEQAARAQADAEQKRLMEQQRRIAREARGEPARNGVTTSSAPAKNAWAEQNAARDTEVASSSNQASLLDTFDVESNSSSNAGISTAATSTTDNVGSGDDDLSRALEESNHESGWSEVKTKKVKNKTTQNGDATPVPSTAVSASKTAQPQKKTSRFGALQDEYVDDPSNWQA
ncbi:uncharacterized protein MYCFIDRAFT_213223 [Pseudocercospora fijiensis CIRAD86]|uniref:Uncharacterized protein n=1 Tax=Pseudocercospora fijiensis (strain CIRAD86) TaxID=383855 RepID=N1QAZ5_PSEFD|nr:uncharacterized protein MYCFIDRAFT_213223 [Pseudocercospora fijiensis CIRAD86]EME88267.1 hypothetical protein MYCFIDRAFT_213223 [Pseudocercospora fijiensis CIRAD86]